MEVVRNRDGGSFQGKCWKRSRNAVVVEIGANRQSCDPSTMLLFKLVLEVVPVGVGSLNGMGNTHREHSNLLKSAD